MLAECLLFDGFEWKKTDLTLLRIWVQKPVVGPILFNPPSDFVQLVF